MKDLSATEASRRFSEILDSVEHDGESYVIRRHGRPVARIEPVQRPNGAAVIELLRRYKPDKSWAKELKELRDSLVIEERHWPD